MFYTARDGDNYMKLQLHRVGLDGAKDVRLTDPAFNHTVGGCMGTQAAAADAADSAPAAADAASRPTTAYFVDVYQTHDTPPATRLVDAGGQGRRGAREERPREVPRSSASSRPRCSPTPRRTERRSCTG